MLTEDQFKKATSLANWAHASEHEWPQGEEIRLVCLALLEASADRERLDWLLNDENDAVSEWIWDKAAELCPVDADEAENTGKWGRAAIDAARKAGE